MNCKCLFTAIGLEVSSLDYKVALDLAEKSGRPVEFLRWGHEIPRIDFKALLQRNISRFLKTGRYILTAQIEFGIEEADRYI